MRGVVMAPDRPDCHDRSVRAYVGVTDGDWYRFLMARHATEANFWQPSGGRRFQAIEQGAPFLFKTHYRDAASNRMVGGGFLSGWASLSVSRAWEFFGEANGCASEAEMRRRIAAYRRTAAPGPDPEVGCIMLNDVFFVSPEHSLEAPPDWARNIVQGKTYALGAVGGSYVESAMRALLAASSEARLLADPDGADPGAEPGAVPGAVFGDPLPTPVRVGQRAFKALVQEAYGRRCAVTGDRIVPVLQAAHIRPVTMDGENCVDNGLLLRSDVHTLFDRGYLGIHPQRRTLMVSPRLRADWGNGEEFYARERSGESIRGTLRPVDNPRTDVLEWHADAVFQAG